MISIFEQEDLFILDHYDDIALFDSDASPETVSYYQMKTNEESISIDTAISKEWTTKLYEHLSAPEWIINELGLITNCPLKIVVHYKDDAGKKRTEEKNYTAERTDTYDIADCYPIFMDSKDARCWDACETGQRWRGECLP